MTTSVFLSNNTVFAACGQEKKGLLAGAKSVIYKMPEGSLLNGMITNEQELTEQLRGFWKAERLPDKGVRLVLESSNFSVKTFDLPKMKQKEAAGVIRREFADIEQYEEKLYDYTFLQENKTGGQTLAVMVNRSYIETWQQIFKNIGVTLEGITVSRETMTRYFASCEELQSGSAVLLLLDDMILTSVLWSEGELVSADRKRMFSAEGTEEFYTEISRSVSSIRQFFTGQKAGKKLEKVYLCGFGEADVACCQERLDDFGLSMRALTLKEPYADNLVAAGGLLKVKKPMNLLFALKNQEKADKSIGEFAKKLVPVGILLGVCVVGAVGLGVACSVRMAKATELSEYLTDAEKMNEKMQVEILQRDIGNMERMLGEAEQIKQMKASYPLVDSGVTNRIKQAAEYDMDVRVLSYDAAAGELRLYINTPIVDSVNQYISTLKNTGMFVDVNYVGYSYLDSTGRYQVEVSCTMRGGVL